LDCNIQYDPKAIKQLKKLDKNSVVAKIATTASDEKTH
jgi:mRNA-degrading endonuclease RelE of RelBE toxin-antitoxin system